MEKMRTWVLGIILIIAPSFLRGQTETENNAYVDEQGVLRWRNDDSEIYGFGVNYTVPFAHAYRMAERLGVDHKEAIRQDVYHFARLDLDLFRVHVWDTEISDSIGNLLENEHLDLFDYTIHEMKKRNMKFVITPIAFWGNGWPEPDEDTPGFSDKYRKAACLTNPDAIKAQVHYLKQFLNHVNPYTGMACKDDPDVIAFEISNEPHHKGTEKEVKSYINKMVRAIRETGTQKPVFYNMSHSIHLVDAYLESDVQGGTFQWYPSGLVAGHALKGNYLPHVSEYRVPFADHPGFQDKAKIIYEFDPADVAGNYMYPAMARSFREAGFQLATQFAYDAMFLAPWNTNYGTHFMSLPYAPQKAISLKIASAVFHEVPRYKEFGDYPQNNQFGNFSVDYEKDLAQYISEKRFFYSNNTASEVPSPEKLTEIAGCGNSSVVKYNGTGAYFLDKLENGIWRLEVMPDVYWLKDPYTPVNPHCKKAAVHHSIRQMTLTLPDIGTEFSINALGQNAELSVWAEDRTFIVRPGVYILKARRTDDEINPMDRYKNIIINEFVAPESNLEKVTVKNHTPEKALANDTLTIRFNIIAPTPLDEVKIFIDSGWRPLEIAASETGVNTYQTIIPADLAKHGTLHYHISVKTRDNSWHTFPAGLFGKPDDWDFVTEKSFKIDFLPVDSPILLWDSEKNWQKSTSTWVRGIELRPSFDGPYLHYNLRLPEQESNEPAHVFKYYFEDDIRSLLPFAQKRKYLVIQGQKIDAESPELEISLIAANGAVRSDIIKLDDTKRLYKIPLELMLPGKFAIVPRSFPSFLPFYADTDTSLHFSIDAIESIQVSLLNRAYREVNFRLDKVWIE